MGWAWPKINGAWLGSVGVASAPAPVARGDTGSGARIITPIKSRQAGQGSKSAYVAGLPCCTENVWQNGHHHQQHRPGPQDRAAAQDRSLHREDKGVQSLGRPDAVL